MPAGSESPTSSVAQAKTNQALYTPVVDFLLMGGGSLLILPLIALVPAKYSEEILFASFLLSFVINYPHFAYSYQIFYRDFPNKMRGNGYPPHLRYRYMFAGLAVPVILILVMAACFMSGSALAMGTLASAMAFFVGWHYVKQGYGMLIVDSVMQRSFFNEREKKTLKINAYAGWIFAFLLASYQIGGKDLFGIKYFFPPVPVELVIGAGAVALVSAGATILAAVQSARRTGKLPFNGYVAYVTSVYIWLATIYTPAVYFIIPAFHSLQYLAVVWKYEFRREAQIVLQQPKSDRDTLIIRYSIFIGTGLILGLAGFVLIPNVLDEAVTYDQALFGGTVFTFMISVFINIHHYFLDNVMWRKDNPDVSKYLFAAPKIESRA